jgi:septal ring factor EnvC (AmiA/AmiB activator)
MTGSSAVRLSLLLLLALPGLASAQDVVRKDLRDSQLRLEQIRKERADLVEQMNTLQSQVHDVASEISNVEKLVSTSTAAVREIDFQTETLTRSVDSTSEMLSENRAKLQQRRARLNQRLRSIYERGPLHSVRVMLSAENFSDFLNRYKYLNLITLNDQMLVDDVSKLENDLVTQDKDLKSNLDQLQRLRAEKVSELAKLKDIEVSHEKTLHNYQQRARQTEGRIAQLARDESRLTDALDEMERKRKEEERRRVVAGAPAVETARGLSTRDIGALKWPVDGDLVYRFGPDRKPNGVVLRNNGIGIAAHAGAPVRSVEAGTVKMARPFEGYGPTVMISHGGGYYTLYLYLGSIAVHEGQQITTGQVIGTVGGEKTPEGAHVEFQVRAPLRAGNSPEPVDPLTWLRTRG